jgi:drug/metabolite transporter (DMT)-like permease
MILVAVFIFDEKYNWSQIIGVVLAFIGVFLIMQKPKKNKK